MEVDQSSPPGQFVTEKFPVMTYGSMPSINLETWRLQFFGMVEREMGFDWRQFIEFPSTTINGGLHCVTQWSRLKNLWGGVLFSEILKKIRPLPFATFVKVICYGGYTTNVSLSDLKDPHSLLAFHHNNSPLSFEHGWPLRLIIPHLYAYKSAKWIHAFEFSDVERKGIWELQGYHSRGDVWKEQRYSTEEDNFG